MIRASDGLDYEDLTARLLDEPANTYRNFRIQSLRALNIAESQISEIAEREEARGDYYVPFSAFYPTSQPPGSGAEGTGGTGPGQA